MLGLPPEQTGVPPLSAGRGGRAGAWKLLSHLPPGGCGYAGTGVTSCLLWALLPPPPPALGRLPSPVLPTMQISRVKTPPALRHNTRPPPPSLPCLGPRSVASRSPLMTVRSLPCPSPTEEQPVSCRRLTELRNLTKGACYLEQVEVSYCGGHCPSSTSVLPEVSSGRGACRLREVAQLADPQGLRLQAQNLGRAQGTRATESSPRPAADQSQAAW